MSSVPPKDSGIPVSETFFFCKCIWKSCERRLCPAISCGWHYWPEGAEFVSWWQWSVLSEFLYLSWAFQHDFGLGKLQDVGVEFRRPGAIFAGLSSNPSAISFSLPYSSIFSSASVTTALFPFIGCPVLLMCPWILGPISFPFVLGSLCKSSASFT